MQRAARACIFEVQKEIPREGHVVAAQNKALNVGLVQLTHCRPPVLMSRSGAIAPRSWTGMALRSRKELHEVGLQQRGRRPLMVGDEVRHRTLRLQRSKRLGNCLSLTAAKKKVVSIWQAFMYSRNAV